MKTKPLSNKEAMNCERAKRNLENSYMTQEKRKKTYTVLEQLNFHWDIKEVEGFRFLWKQGISLFDLCSYFKRSQEEMALLIIDQSLKGYIKPRKNGLFS